MDEKELQQAYTRHCEITGQNKMTCTGFEDFKAGFKLGRPATGEPAVPLDGLHVVRAGYHRTQGKERTKVMQMEASFHRTEYAASFAAYVEAWMFGASAFGWVETIEEPIKFVAMRAQAGEGGAA